MDLHSTSSTDMTVSSGEYIESIHHFGAEYQKEAKTSSSLAPFAQKTVPKLKEYADTLQLFNTQNDEAIKLAKDFRPDLESLTKVLESKLKKV